MAVLLSAVYIDVMIDILMQLLLVLQELQLIAFMPAEIDDVHAYTTHS